jgi:hypothetical protein
MRLFLFNDIMPDSVSEHNIIEALTNSIFEYKILKEEFDEHIDGIISTTALSSISLLNDLSLATCLSKINNKEIKVYAYSIFTKYPVEQFIEIDSVLTEGKQYTFMLDVEEKDALFIKIVYKNNGLLFSLNLHKDLAKDYLNIISPGNSDYFSIENLFGCKNNTEVIREVLRTEERGKLENFERLKKILNEPECSDKFKNTFSKVSKEIQNIIIEGFTTILQNKAAGIYTPETLLKDVTPPKELKIAVKELKVRDPIAKRIYFTEHNGKYYLASVENKPLKDRETKEQNIHIKSALSTLKQLLKN